jgi:hypothetical protein
MSSASSDRPRLRAASSSAVANASSQTPTLNVVPSARDLTSTDGKAGPSADRISPLMVASRPLVANGSTTWTPRWGGQVVTTGSSGISLARSIGGRQNSTRRDAAFPFEIGKA